MTDLDDAKAAVAHAEWLASEDFALVLDEERVKREALDRALGLEMLGYSRWRDFSVSARLQLGREQDVEPSIRVTATDGNEYRLYGPELKLPYPRWPHGVL